MAFAHNSMLRGLNSLYLQADLSNSQDIEDFLFFLRSWAGWVSHHHALEEEQMFPQFEEAMKQPNFLQGNIEEHHTFQPALEKLLAYGETRPEEYQASIVRSLIEEMAPSFREHLAHEITSLLSMASYDGAPLLKVYKECEVEAGKQDKEKDFCFLFMLLFSL
jgi:hemerythrin-like domain-containing protein